LFSIAVGYGVSHQIREERDAIKIKRRIEFLVIQMNFSPLKDVGMLVPFPPLKIGSSLTDKPSDIKQAVWAFNRERS